MGASILAFLAEQVAWIVDPHFEGGPGLELENIAGGLLPIGECDQGRSGVPLAGVQIASAWNLHTNRIAAGRQVRNLECAVRRRFGGLAGRGQPAADRGDVRGGDRVVGGPVGYASLNGRGVWGARNAGERTKSRDTRVVRSMNVVPKWRNGA